MLRDEIKNCMSDLHLNETGAICASFTFPPNFTGFNGHFPNLPILPGVCTLQAVISMMEMQRGEQLRIEEITQAKFSALVFPKQTLEYICTETETEGITTSLKAVVMRQHKKIAEIFMKVSSNGAAQTWHRDKSGADQ
ncbi:MAG: hypothetical protein JXN60_09795 [Lentisphaerae bacterium]|nr:hypothetical protein [Lentisphaerota bacterium]